MEPGSILIPCRTERSSLRRMSRLSASCLGALAVMLAAAAAAQTIYRETDAAGRVSFRDTPQLASEIAAVPPGPRISFLRNAQIDAEEAARRRRQDQRQEARKQALGRSLPVWER